MCSYVIHPLKDHKLLFIAYSELEEFQKN